MDASIGLIVPTRGHFDYALSTIRSAVRPAIEHAYPHPACEHGTQRDTTMRPCNARETVVILVDDASPDWPRQGVMEGLMPTSAPWVIVRFDSQGGLSRSWNAGLLVARSMGLEFAVCANSDLIFAENWWEGIKQALETFDFAGPVTNAPGHVPMQNVTRYVSEYEMDDDLDAIDSTGRLLAERAGEPIGRSILNGFCIAGRVASFFHVAGESGDVFSEWIPLAGNEDDFFERAKSRGLRPAIAPTSFVFHYRSVTRGLRRRATHAGGSPSPVNGPLHPVDRGAYRTGCRGCRQRDA